MNYLQGRMVRNALPGDRAPLLAGIARRHLVLLQEIGPQPRPAEPESINRQRRRHRRELDQLQALARVLKLNVPGVTDAA